MNLDNAHILGIAFLCLIALLTGFFLVLRLREQFAEKPDPKLTYATITELERLRAALQQFERDHREEHEARDHQWRTTQIHTTDLLHRNAEQIAALVAQIQMLLQRVTELQTRVERLAERLMA